MFVRPTAFLAPWIMLMLSCPLTGVSAGPQDEITVRRAWNKRHAQVRTARYRVTWEDTRLDGPSKVRQQGNLEADFACDKRTYRFEVQHEQKATTLLLDRNGLHQKPTSRERSTDEARQENVKSVTPQSPWILAYPLLLSHGIVPMPPFSHAGLMRTVARPPRTRTGTPDSEGSMRLEDFRWSDPENEQHGEVRVQSPGGLVAVFEVWRDFRRILRIDISYGRHQGVPVASRYTIEWFADDGNVERRVNARVTTLELNNPLEAITAQAPRDRDEVLASLAGQWDRQVRVQPEMSIDAVAALLQETLGAELTVRVDEEAFHKPIEFEKRIVSFEDETVTLADLLLDKLQSQALDFVFDGQGLAILPRHVAWQFSEGRTYAAKDYGLSVHELRDVLYKTANAEEWDDVGGPGSLTVDDETGSVVILHTQSEHVYFERDLRRIQQERKQHRP